MTALEKRVRKTAAEALKWERVFEENSPWEDPKSFAEINGKIVKSQRAFRAALKAWLAIGDDDIADNFLFAVALDVTDRVGLAARIRKLENKFKRFEVRLNKTESLGDSLNRRTTGLITLGAQR